MKGLKNLGVWVIAIGLIYLIISVLLKLVLPVLLIPSLFPDNKIKPLEWVTFTPEKSSETIPFTGTNLLIDIYQPVLNLGPTDLILLVHGANIAGKDDPRIINFAQTLSRTGNIVAVGHYPDITRKSFSPAANEQVMKSLEYIIDKYPKKKIKVVSFSVASGPVLTAASNEKITTRIDLIVTLGAYADLKSLLKYLTTGQHEYQGQIFEEEADPFGREFILHQLKAAVSAHPLTSELINNTDPEKFEALYSRQPQKVTQYLDGLTPKEEVLDKLKSIRIILVHSQPDLVVPHTQSMLLKDMMDAKPELIFLQTFSHVNAQLPKFNFKTLYNFYFPELVKIYRIISALI